MKPYRVPLLQTEDERTLRLLVPEAIVEGRYESLTEQELEDHAADISAEADRRNGKVGSREVESG